MSHFNSKKFLSEKMKGFNFAKNKFYILDLFISLEKPPKIQL